MQFEWEMGLVLQSEMRTARFGSLFDYSEKDPAQSSCRSVEILIFQKYFDVVGMAQHRAWINRFRQRRAFEHDGRDAFLREQSHNFSADAAKDLVAQLFFE